MTCRRGLAAWCWPMVLIAWLWFALGVANAAPLVERLDSVGIPVTDADRSRAFYHSVLGFRVVADREVHGEAYERLFGVFGVRLRSVRMALGEEHIELMQFLAPRGRSLPADTRSNDLWFQHIAIIVSDMDAAYARLREHRVAHVSSAPQRLPDWNPGAGGIKAFYFRDPDGNHLEILQFPPGKGEPRWQRRNSLFLGIDHTAIVVSDTERSMQFYRDTLGMRVAGASENHGTEQEHLNNVFGAHLRITALRAAAGPGVEFLEYLAPQGGRAAPADSTAADGWYWQINFAGADPGRAARPGGELVRLPSPELGISRAVTLRDPDGHASLIFESKP
jgi:catechol 2,3-dioxygenase-like lactoylglutathione lyase family enzyme